MHGLDSGGLCALHIQDPAHERFREWNRCSHRFMGCMHLSEKPRSGKCYACNQRYLPCVNANRGCLRHVYHDPYTRTRKQCLSHASQLCPFSSSADALRCTVQLCPTLRENRDLLHCSLCADGRYPCMMNCGRRADCGAEALCKLCLEIPMQSASETTTTLSVSRSLVCERSSAALCSVPACCNLVIACDMCSLCASSCFPCKTMTCKRRTVPGAAWIDGILQLFALFYGRVQSICVITYFPLYHSYALLLPFLDVL